MKNTLLSLFFVLFSFKLLSQAPSLKNPKNSILLKNGDTVLLQQRGPASEKQSKLTVLNPSNLHIFVIKDNTIDIQRSQKLVDAFFSGPDPEIKDLAKSLKVELGRLNPLEDFTPVEIKRLNKNEFEITITQMECSFVMYETLDDPVCNLFFANPDSKNVTCRSLVIVASDDLQVVKRRAANVTRTRKECQKDIRTMNDGI